MHSSLVRERNKDEKSEGCSRIPYWFYAGLAGVTEPRLGACRRLGACDRLEITADAIAACQLSAMQQLYIFGTENTIYCLKQC